MLAWSCVAAALSARSPRSLAGLCWSLRLPHRAVRGAQVVACLRSLSVWLSLAELGFQCCAVRRLCRLWWPFATRSSEVAPSGASVFGRSSASVALELRSTLRRAAAADRSRLSLPRCVAPRSRHATLSTRSVQAQPPGGHIRIRDRQRCRLRRILLRRCYCCGALLNHQ